MSLLGDSNSNVTVKKVCIGANRYSSQRGKAAFLNCVDSYQDSEDNHGEFGIQFRITYDEFSQVAALKPSLLAPVVVTLEGQFQTFAGEQRFTPTALLAVAPFKPVSTPPATKPADK